MYTMTVQANNEFRGAWLITFYSCDGKLRVLRGRITGAECWDFADMKFDKDFAFCIGGGGYPAVTIPAKEMRKLEKLVPVPFRIGVVVKNHFIKLFSGGELKAYGPSGEMAIADIPVEVLERLRCDG